MPNTEGQRDSSDSISQHCMCTVRPLIVVPLGRNVWVLVVYLLGVQVPQHCLYNSFASTDRCNSNNNKSAGDAQEGRQLREYVVKEVEGLECFECIEADQLQLLKLKDAPRPAGAAPQSQTPTQAPGVHRGSSPLELTDSDSSVETTDCLSNGVLEPTAPTWRHLACSAAASGQKMDESEPDVVVCPQTEQPYLCVAEIVHAGSCGVVAVIPPIGALEVENPMLYSAVCTHL